MKVQQKISLLLVAFLLVCTISYAGPAICDVTNAAIAEGDGYLASTTEVLGSKYYWKYFEETAGVMGMDDEDSMKQYAVQINQMGGKTPWLLSNEAAQMLLLNDTTHRDWAIEWWRSNKRFAPPGNGPIQIEKAYQAIHNRNR
ncbi:hypothetical protein KJ966_20785 [bacterium]|nr:hypothetical protein [bacterium]